VEWLNYHHLLYFWTVAREGSITRASRLLHLAQPTISAQIHALEEAVGEPLFHRSGRSLVMTDFGRLVYRYADQIFSLGRELMGAVQQRPTTRSLRLTVGVSDALPKLMVYRILQPALEMSTPVQLIVHEDKPDRLLAELSLLGLDLILTDAPLGPNVRVRAFSHQLGVSPVTLFAAPKLAARLRTNFPQSLNGAPMLVPMDGSPLRRALDQWISKTGLQPQVMGEFQDSALMKVFGEGGAGFFAAPTLIEEDVKRTFKVHSIGRLDGVEEKFYAISVERKFKHPAVVAISESAKQSLSVAALA
jgi:LysR family transcriptional activator of nhaA